MKHKIMTEIVMYSVAITSLLFWVYQFCVFFLGYELTWKEPNQVISLMEFMIASSVLVYFIGTIKYKIDKNKNVI